jgi:hypothetical protein
MLMVRVLLNPERKISRVFITIKKLLRKYFQRSFYKSVDILKSDFYKLM